MIQNLFSMTGKICLITGGSSGLGSYMAAGFLAAGAERVFITGRSEDKLSKKAGELSALSEGQCIPISGDLSDLEGVQALAEAISERESHLDVLVNNAGLGLGTQIQTMTAKAWDKSMDLNTRSPLFLDTALLELLKARQRWMTLRALSLSVRLPLVESCLVCSLTRLARKPWNTSRHL